jgi:hypothetical protein
MCRYKQALIATRTLTQTVCPRTSIGTRCSTPAQELQTRILRPHPWRRQQLAVDAARLSLCVVDLVDQAGRPIANQEISFFMEDVPLAVDGFQVGLGRVQVNMRTNVNGHAEMALIRGSSLRVVFVGTSLIRSIVVPDADTFNLLTLVSNAADPFSVVTPNLPSAIRRTI